MSVEQKHLYKSGASESESPGTIPTATTGTRLLRYALLVLVPLMLAAVAFALLSREKAARRVQIQTTPAEQPRLTASYPVRPKAVDDCLQGRNLYSNKPTEQNLNKAIAHFSSAIDEDPNYA